MISRSEEEIFEQAVREIAVEEAKGKHTAPRRWISEEQAIEYLMKRHKCSREDAIHRLEILRWGIPSAVRKRPNG